MNCKIMSSNAFLRFKEAFYFDFHKACINVSTYFIPLDEEVTIRKMTEKSDLRELRRVYRQYKEYIIKHGGGEYTMETREKSCNCICSIEVFSTITSAAGYQALAGSDHSRSEFYVPYNVLPLDQGGVHHPIRQLPEA